MKNNVVSCLETIYPLTVTLSIQQAFPANEVQTMKSICKKILLLLTLCALPTLAFATENAAGEKSTTPPSQPAQQTATETAPKTPEAPKQQPAIMIGYVDLVRVSTESEPGKSGQIKLIGKKQKLQTQIEAKRKQLDKQKAAIEAKLPTLTPGQRESKAKEFQKKVAEYQNFVEKSEKELQDLQQELSRALFEMIEKAASEYGKSKDLALVTVKRDLVYLAGNVTPQDVTEGVVKLINETMPKK